MAKTTTCDMCGRMVAQYGFVVSRSWYPENPTDVCSVECLQRYAVAALGPTRAEIEELVPNG